MFASPLRGIRNRGLIVLVSDAMALHTRCTIAPALILSVFRTTFTGGRSSRPLLRDRQVNAVDPLARERKESTGAASLARIGHCKSIGSQCAVDSDLADYVAFSQRNARHGHGGGPPRACSSGTGEQSRASGLVFLVGAADCVLDAIRDLRSRHRAGHPQVRAQASGHFPELHSAGGEETAEQSTRDPFIHPDLPARGNTRQPVKVSGRLCRDPSLSLPTEPPGATPKCPTRSHCPTWSQYLSVLSRSE